MAFLQNLNVAIVNGIPVKQHVVEAQLPENSQKKFHKFKKLSKF